MWLLIPIIIYSLIYLVIRHIYTYWVRKGFPSETTGLKWDFLKRAYIREFDYVEALSDMYKKTSMPLYGFYNFFRPTLMIRDLSLAHSLLENPFGNFAEEKWECVKGYKRFNILERLAPVFSNSRIDGMFRHIEKVSDDMVNHLKTLKPSLTYDEVNTDLQHVCRIYAVNIISNLIYGMDLNIFSDNENVFGNYLQNTLSSYTVSSYTLNRLPKRSALTYRLRDVLQENIDIREQGGVIRKDVLQLLAKFRNGNDLSNSSKLNWHVENAFVRLTSIKILSKIAEQFLNIGWENMASAITLTLYEVLQQPETLQKILKEIQNIPKSTEGEAPVLTTSTLEDLKFLDLCVKETLRKYPAIPFIERVCRKTHSIPYTRYTIGTGKVIVIPILAIQHDEAYFPEPFKYRPIRFTIKGQHTKEAFLSYGLGAGTCIAQNFANIVIKVALVKLFMNFNICLQDVNSIEIGYSPAPFIKSKLGLNVKMKAKDSKPKFDR